MEKQETEKGRQPVAGKAKSKVNVKWLKGKDQETKTRLKSEVEASVFIFKRLDEIISNEIETIRALARKEETLQQANWPNLQAYYLGKEQGLETIRNLLIKED